MPKQNVPALRLEGFDGEWNEMRLDQLFSSGSSGGTPSTNKPEFYGGDIPFLGISDIHSREVLSTEKTITQLGLENSAATLVPPGTVALAMYASVGRVGILGQEMATSQAFYNMTFSDKETRDFVFTRLQMMESAGEWEPVIGAGTQRNLNAEKVRATCVQIPPTLEEQQAIGAIFTNLDAAINQHTLKHKALQQSKTALMQRMFPQEGQTVPELRLEGFSGEWEETTLGELGSTYGGLSGKKKQDFGHGDAMYVTYKDIFSRALITDTSQCERVEVDTSQNEVRYGDIFFTTSSEIPEEVGLSAVWLIDKPNVYLNSFCFGFRPTGGFDLHFLGHVLRCPAVRSQFLLLAQGISRFNISKTKAANISLYAPPTLEEQQAIGAVFTNLDRLIAAEAQYIESFKQAKTALLQRMFI